MTAMLGVLGGGQLGNFFVLAAKKMGYQTAVLDPDPHAPAGVNADIHIVAPFDDIDALNQLASMCSAVTIEFENPPVTALEHLAQQVTVRPSPSAVAIAQNRREEKQFCQSIGLSVAPYEVLETREDLERIAKNGVAETHLDPFSVPLFMKTCRNGYDGKGQQIVKQLSNISDHWNALGNVPCVVEQKVALDAEFSVIISRNEQGRIALFAPTQNVHLNGVLDVSTAPSQLDSQMLDQGKLAATKIAEKLDYVGVLAVEFFVSNNKLFVNELAPRPHNSGHWTLDAANTSQFEQQVRALVGEPLGDPSMTCSAVAMVNLLGDRWANGEPLFELTNTDSCAHLYLYGKKDARAGRKMGHLTMTGDHVEAATNSAISLRNAITR
ncbi:MAG: 5-(carboxyamino)imidazole ribonucleotide synthase [Actinobacteria bacterium]|nr:5-(carboxyamino)imidazole ribonucleotide synthase [Actinomycetota bacterium]